MNENLDKKVVQIKPTGLFTNYIFKAIPLYFDESMSYYETLCGLLSYLKEAIIPALNNNADAIIEVQELVTRLENYMNNYFTNLDVQKEINNKLDVMASDGTLDKIINQNIFNELNEKITTTQNQIKNDTILSFDNVSELKNATNLDSGSVVKTLGYENIQDELGAFYKIREKQESDVIDNDNIIEISNTTLVAEKIKKPFLIKSLTFENEVYPTEMTFNKAYIGCTESYGDNNPQVAFISEHEPHENFLFQHNAYGMFIKSTAKGSGTAIPNKGTQIGLLVNSIQKSKYIDDNVNTPDYKGSNIGMVAFAQGGYSGDNTVNCGLWSYAVTPKLTQEQFNKIEQNTTTLGMEINIEMLQPNKSTFSDYIFPGSVAGILINNYNEPATHPERQIYDFGIILNGNSIDGDYSKQGIKHYNAFWTGLQLDKIEAYGLRFGQYINNDATLISIPDNYSYEDKSPNVVGINMGNSRLQLGEYRGDKFDPGDLWRNGDILYYKGADGIVHDLVMTDRAINKPLILGVELTGNYPNNSLWSANNLLFFKDNTGAIHQLTYAS